MTKYAITSKTQKINIKTASPTKISIKQASKSNIVIKSTQRGEKGEKGDTGESILVDVTAGDNITLNKTGQTTVISAKGDSTYTYNFTASSVVEVNHNLGKYASIAVIDSAGEEVEGNVLQRNLNQVVIEFSAPFSGKVICN